MYRKVWFSNGTECTAGLVITNAWIAEHKANFTADVSRLFPMYEARKMVTLHCSPAFDTWDKAFLFETHVTRAAK